MRSSGFLFNNAGALCLDCKENTPTSFAPYRRRQCAPRWQQLPFSDAYTTKKKQKKNMGHSVATATFQRYIHDKNFSKTETKNMRHSTRSPFNRTYLWPDGVQKTPFLPQEPQHLPVLIHQRRHPYVGPSTPRATAAHRGGQFAPSLSRYPLTAHGFDGFQSGTAVSFDDARRKVLKV